MNKLKMPLRLAGGVLALLLAGCASPPPPTHPAAVQALTAAARFAGTDAAAPALDPAWWRNFGDDTLAGLIERALAANHDVRIATQRWREAGAGQTASASRLWPTVGVQASASDERSGLPDEVKRGKPDTRALRAGVDVAWEIDLFGAARASATAAERDGQAAAFGIEAARLLVASEVARQYWTWQGGRARLEALERLLQTQRETERVVRRREGDGQSSRFDVARAAGETQALAAQLPPLRTLIATSTHRIALLLGASASEPVTALTSPSAPRLPEIVPVSAGQPAALLQRRPDVLAAERQWAAAGARVAEARADIWPKVFVSALVGQQDLKLNTLALAPVRFSNAGLLFLLPIFNAGRLNAAIEGQSAREQAALLAYEKVVLTAVEDVENSLVLLRDERERLSTLDAAAVQRDTALRHAESLHREGQIDLLPLLDAQRGVIATELARIDSRTQQALNAVTLFKSLGGGWALADTKTSRWVAPVSVALAAPSNLVQERDQP